LGVALLKRGQMEAAFECLRRAVALEPENSLYHNTLGAALASTRRFEEAAESFRRAVGLEPRFAEAHYNLGKALRVAGRVEEAVECYRAALKLRPQWPEVHYDLGNALRATGKPKEAEAAYRQALRLRPGYFKALANLGNLLGGLKRLPEAEACYRQAVERYPSHARAHAGLGNVLLRQRRWDEAEGCFRKALELDAGLLSALRGLVRALIAREKLDDAADLLTQWSERAEALTDCWLNLAERLCNAGRVDEALEWTQKALERQPDLAAAHQNLGLVLAAQGKLEEALACYRRALQLRPDIAAAQNNLAVALHTLGRHKEAAEHLERALHLRPDMAVAHLNRALLWLREGRWQQGWQEFEWRRLCKDFRLRPTRQPVWTGEPRPQGTILLHAEQGLGDTIQLVRYAPLVRERVGTVILECQPALEKLLARSPGIDRLLPLSRRPPKHDVHCALFSLPGLFETTVESVPAEVPYIFADKSLVEQWRARLAEYPGFKVGIAWQGNRKYAGDRFRSIPLKNFAPLAQIEGVTLFSLQKGPGSEQIEQLAEAGEEFPLIDFGEQFDKDAGPFMDTAAVMQNLDLIITSDTAVAHLAGAMARPVWLLLSTAADWRWLEGIEHCPWYPTMRVFRQERLDHWEEVFARVAQELRCVVQGDRTRLASARESEDKQAISRLLSGKRPRVSAAETASPSAGPIPVPVSPGELLDRLSILEIKCQRITDPAKLAFVRREYAEYQALRQRCLGHLWPAGECQPGNYSAPPDALPCRTPARASAHPADQATVDDASKTLVRLYSELKAVNEQLWDIENQVRDCEARQDFGPQFVELARAVYQTNDRRSALKRRIDELLGSTFVEQKDYTAYNL